jgi:anti-anti-sigma regulatory factor
MPSPSIFLAEPLRLSIGGALDVRFGADRADATSLLPEDAPASAIIDLDDLEILGSTGIEVLCAVRTRAAELGVTLTFVNIHRQPRRRIAAEGLNSYFGLESMTSRGRLRPRAKATSPTLTTPAPATPVAASPRG